MISNYFYHEILRKTIISFGTLFNDIQIKHKDRAGADFSIITVPIAYGPIQKFLARIEQSPTVRKEVAITLPRMSFEMTGIQYDASRKSSTMQTFKSVDSDKNQVVKSFMPVPYNINFQLSILSKLNEDALQILEQILPYFQPHLNLTVDLASSIGEKRDIPMILEGISMDDQYEGDFTTRRALIYTLNFTAKTYLFGPIGNFNDSLIKKVQVDYHTNTNTINSSRQLRYVAEPRALRDYNSDESAIILGNIDENVTEISVSEIAKFTQGIYVQIGDEVMYVRKVGDTEILVNRGENNTVASTHDEGTAINIIDNLDNQLISLDDDFGFSEYRFDFEDGKVYSPSKGIDL
jgi:hypothetical protein